MVEETSTAQFASNTNMRTIKSFVKREGRMTPGQKRALTTLWPRYGIDLRVDTVIPFDQVFSTPGPIILEIGFGMGEAIADMADHNRTENFIGIEVHRPGVGRLLACADKLNLINLAVICADAVEVVSHHIADNTLKRVQIFFPDPWHKKKHHKRRLIQTDFISLLAKKIAPGGQLHIATDWQHYAEHIIDVLQASPDFENCAKNALYVERPSQRPLTRFEQRGHRLGHGVWDILFYKLDTIHHLETKG